MLFDVAIFHKLRQLLNLTAGGLARLTYRAEQLSRQKEPARVTGPARLM